MAKEVPLGATPVGVAPDEKIRIVFTMGSLAIGGAERWVLKMVERLDRDKFDCSVITVKPLRPPDNALAPEFKRLGVPVFSLRLRLYQLLFPLGTMRMKRLLKRIDPHIIQTLLLVDRFYAVRAAASLDLPVVSSFQGASAVQGLSGFKKRLYMEHLECSDVIVAVSEHTRGFLPEELQESACVIYNFIDTKEFSPPRGRSYSGKQEFTLGTVARLAPVKRTVELIRLFADIRSRLPFIKRLMIVGDGPDRESIEEAVRSCGVVNAVELAGSQDDVKPWFEKMDFFVSLSASEGMPNAMLEAMSSGVVPIVTSVGGVPEAVIDGENGFLLDPDLGAGNLQRFEEILVDCVKNPSRFNAIAKAARKTVVSRFSSDVIIPQYEEVYTRIANKRDLPE